MPRCLSPPYRATFDELLAPPSGDDASRPTGTVVRASAAYSTRDERFLLKHKDYDRQYAQLYFYRLLQMRAHVEAAARAAWPGISGAAADSMLCGADLLFELLQALHSCRSRSCLPLRESAAPIPLPAVVRILSVPEDGEVAVVGTLYKEMALKPSILDE